MKTLLTILAIMLFISAQAINPYRAYLLTQALSYHPQIKVSGQPTQQQSNIKTTCTIPQYQIPKGSVFCRMEDKLTKATGIWIKVGVK